MEQLPGKELGREAARKVKELYGYCCADVDHEMEGWKDGTAKEKAQRHTVKRSDGKARLLEF